MNIKKIRFMAICVLLLTESTHAQKVSDDTYYNPKELTAFNNDLETLNQGFPTLYQLSMGYLHEIDFKKMTDVQWNELWAEIENAQPVIDTMNYRIRIRYNVLIGKCATQGTAPVKEKAWSRLENILLGEVILKSWNDVSAITRLMHCLTEINTDESINLLILLSQRVNWSNRVKIFDLFNGGEDSWFNQEVLTEDSLMQFKEAAMNNFIATTLDRLFFSSHSLAKKFRDELRITALADDPYADPMVIRSWKMYHTFIPNLEGRSDLINNGQNREFPLDFLF